MHRLCMTCAVGWEGKKKEGWVLTTFSPLPSAPKVALIIPGTRERLSAVLLRSTQTNFGF